MGVQPSTLNPQPFINALGLHQRPCAAAAGKSRFHPHMARMRHSNHQPIHEPTHEPSTRTNPTWCTVMVSSSFFVTSVTKKHSVSSHLGLVLLILADVFSAWSCSRAKLVGPFGFRVWVWGFGFRVWVWGLGFRVWGFGFRVPGLGFGFGVWGLGFGVWGLGFRV